MKHVVPAVVGVCAVTVFIVSLIGHFTFEGAREVSYRACVETAAAYTVEAIAEQADRCSEAVYNR